MGSVSRWNEHVIKERNVGNTVSLERIITDYVTRYQSVKKQDVVNYVYKKIGDSYRDAEFNANINRVIRELIKHRKIQLKEGLLCLISG